jgi:hypothetical protein
MVLIQGINQRGDVLGYSFTQYGAAAYHERVGVWDRSNVFQPYFEETNNTQVLLFNNHNQIVITESDDAHSYLVPSPGTRLDLATLVPNLPAGVQLVQVVGIDDDGNITGNATDPTFTNSYTFLLQPMRNGEGAGECHMGGSRVPWAVAHARHPHPHK